MEVEGSRKNKKDKEKEKEKSKYRYVCIIDIFPKPYFFGASKFDSDLLTRMF